MKLGAQGAVVVTRDALIADNASKNSPVRRRADFDPLGQIEFLVLIVAHRVPRIAGNTHQTCEVPFAQETSV